MLKEWREMFDPDITHLINSLSHPLPLNMWKPKDLHNADLMVKLGLIQVPEDIDNRNEYLTERLAAMEEQFASFEFMIWSKTKF